MSRNIASYSWSSDVSSACSFACGMPGTSFGPKFALDTDDANKLEEM
eukprot:CAMPEP_0185752302 /NCGR_PEP_ID=MMETSP1174-20130828/11110_1 /TAXON_ID=35687 /ORGANISM="Dictyocha speculum, Strain CCMP1381" /LENGTH=46 /DNA_ID= /DNA_START= /DNA_END= /DNA_ORIENTATION=